MQPFQKVHPHAASQMNRETNAGVKECDQSCPDAGVTSQIEADRIWV
jgi:hypothetical protein